MSENAPRAWTDPERQQLLDILRGGEPYPAAARHLRRSEVDCRAEAALLRDAGWGATGAMRRHRVPPASRRCLTCSGAFAPETRFLFMCRGCRRTSAGIAA